jgi:hypothetical protein
MKLLRQIIRQMLLEDISAFWKDFDAAKNTRKIKTTGKYGNLAVGSGGGKEIKKLFRKHADHQWFKKNVNTVHWGRPHKLKKIKGKNKDEFSCTMSLKGKPFPGANSFGSVGLWLDGWITLAANDQDDIVSGYESDYKPSHVALIQDEEYQHRKSSSGINKVPSTTGHRNPNYSSSYVLGPDEFDLDNESYINEALVDNWECIGVVVSDEISKTIEENWPKFEDFEIEEILRLGDIFDRPIYRMDGSVLRYPGEMKTDEVEFV